MLQDSLPPHVRMARAAAMYAWARQLIGREIVARTGPLSAARLKWETAPLARGLDSFITAAEEAGFLLDAESVRRGVADGSMFQLFDMAEALKIDLYPRELVPGELGRSRFSRACHCWWRPGPARRHQNVVGRRKGATRVGATCDRSSGG